MTDREIGATPQTAGVVSPTLVDRGPRSMLHSGWVSEPDGSLHRNKSIASRLKV
jgi:hypothetical protein